MKVADHRTEQTESQNKAARLGRLPHFETVQEAAEFWDTHDSVEFEDEFEDVPEVQFVVQRAYPKKGITVRLAEDQLALLRAEAAEKGVGPSTWARMLILDHLRQRQSKASSE